MTNNLVFDKEYLRELYDGSQATLLEMAAPSYLHSNPLIRWIVKERMRTVLRFIDMRNGKNLLDFGCGAGILFLQLPKASGTYTGVDLEIWPAQKMMAHHGRDDVQLLSGEEWTKAVSDNSVDNIVALEVLEHVDDLAAQLEIFKSKLKADGRLIVSGPTESGVYKLARMVSGFSGHYHVRNIYDIQKAVKAAGFREERRKALPLPGFFSLFIVYEYKK
jgi:2-polyprenyl-3-methyl-5-hydroxy-6-metoxy-1,4-benzoquinol methylase